MSAASLALEQHRRGSVPDLNAVPPYQWQIYFDELSRICPSSIQVIPVRQRNALRIEILPDTGPRCSQLSPDGRGLAWLLSGGDPLSYRACSMAACPRCKAVRP